MECITDPLLGKAQHTLPPRGAGLAAVACASDTTLPGSKDDEVGGYLWLCLPRWSVLEIKMVLMNGQRRERGSEGPGPGHWQRGGVL